MKYGVLYRCSERDQNREDRLRGHAIRYRRQLQEYRRGLEEEREAREAAEARSAEKDRKFAAVCHDLRTPLNAILGWAQLARLGGTEAELGEALANIESSAELQAMLISDVLDLAKSAGGPLPIDRKPVDLNAVVAGAAGIVAPAAAAKGVAVERRPCSRPALVLGDAMRLQRVAWNLLANAVKFTPRRGRVTATVEAGRGAVTVRVSDTGRGIDPAFLPRVFERFEQHVPDGERHRGGSGLGLTIVRRLVELHGGTVAAASAGVGHGATFTVWLPALDAESVEEAVGPPGSVRATRYI